jgi:C4-dicarboxylate-specific signal transduction histidine kinase
MKILISNIPKHHLEIYFRNYHLNSSYKFTFKEVGRKSAHNNYNLPIKSYAPGIPPEIIDKIFQHFFTIKLTGSGTSPFLSLCYDIAKAHGGKISVDSIDNDGTTFTIRIPIKS